MTPWYDYSSLQFALFPGGASTRLRYNVSGLPSLHLERVFFLLMRPRDQIDGVQGPGLKDV